MLREISAGGVVVRKRDERWWMAAIELPPTCGRSEPQAKATRKVAKSVMALPKGLVDPGEKPVETAVREVHEETGVIAEVVTKLSDIKYIYTRTWADGERVFKIVSFYLMRYCSGHINEISPEMRIEVARAAWIALEDAPVLLAYKGEREVARKALDFVRENSELQS
jgi:8-oxo-dGTP pyrophosphatase MutT (NUDIX family)